MSTDETKVLLYDLIENSDEKLIPILYSLAMEYNHQHHEYSEIFLAELKERHSKYLSGESKSYTWDQIKEKITRRAR